MANTLEEAKDILATGIAMGLNTPAIPGMVAWRVDILDTSIFDPMEAGGVTLGFYPTQKAAMRALARWVVRDLISIEEAGLEAPWETAGESADQWLSSRTAADIVNEYFVGSESEFYEIKEIRIMGGGNPEGPLTLAECSTIQE